MDKIHTKLLPAFDLVKDSANIAHAARLLREGQLVVFPTETVYGIGANALDEHAVRNIFKAKGRPQDNPLIVHIANFEEITPLVKEIPEEAYKLAAAFWPGPLTMIFPKSDLVSASISAGLDTVAIRVPSHPITKALLEQSGVPIAAPSANRSGSPSPTIAAHSYADLQGRVPLVLDGGATQVGLESTVITFAHGTPKILRPGAITPEDIQSITGQVILDPAVLARLEGHRLASSPGLKHKHYSPKAKIILVRGSSQEFASYCKNNSTENTWAMAFAEDIPRLNIPSVSYGKHEDVHEQGRLLFSVLRELDDKGAKTVFVHAPEPKGIGLAVYNRLLRAASFREINASEVEDTL